MTLNFITKANKVHNNKFNYDKTIYLNSNKNVIVTCTQHGGFLVTPNNHLSNKSGCPECKKKHKLHLDKFLKRADDKFNGKFNYDNIIFINNITHINIICPKHGEFKQTPQNHLLSGCKLCNDEERLSKKNNDFIEKSNIIHSNKYNYKYVIYRGRHEVIKIICDVHGEFEQEAGVHLRGHGCQICSSSKGELKVLDYLISNNISHEREYSFNECKFKYKLKFDFYLTKHNICIEYDGRQHYEPIDTFGGVCEFNKTIKRDEIKTKYCKDNNIKLIRIPYWSYKIIKDILNESIN